MKFIEQLLKAKGWQSTDQFIEAHKHLLTEEAEVLESVNVVVVENDGMGKENQ